MLRDELASISPRGDERAAGPTCAFIARAHFVFFCSCVFFATSGRRGRLSSLRPRVTCCVTNLRPYRFAATSVLQGLPAFLSLGRVLSCSGVFIVTSGFRGRGGWLRHRVPCGGRHLRRPSRRQGGRRWGRRLVWADGAAACARLGRFFFSPARVEARLTVLQCWKTVRERHGGVLSGAASWQLGRLLHAPGRGSALLRRPRFVLLRRTGHLSTGF